MSLSVEVLIQALKGDKKAIEHVVKQYTPLVYKTVNKYGFLAPGASRQDLVQEGFIGILNALETFNPPGEITLESWMTWVFWKVRGAVKSAARKEKRFSPSPDESENKKRPQLVTRVVSESLESFENGLELQQVSSETFDFEMEPNVPSISQIVMEGCGSLESTKAKIICSKFGLLGHMPKRPVELAKEFGISKQSVSGYIARFSKTIRSKYPELADLIK